MQTLEEGYALGIVGTHHLERTTCVGSAIIGHHAAEAVGDARLQSLEGGVLAIGPDARHESMVMNLGE